MTFDPMSELISNIKNAQTVGKQEIVISFSNLKKAILIVLKNRGYIANFKEIQSDKKRNIQVVLKYVGKVPAIHNLKQLSKPGRRSYVSCREIPWPKSGYGCVILSTSKGVLAANEAKTAGVGGEVLLEIS